MNKNDISALDAEPDPVLIRLGFMLLPQFAMGTFAAFADLLGMLDAQVDMPGPCAWEVVADTLIPVRSASGVQVVPTDLLGDPLRFDYLVVVGGPLPPTSPFGAGLLNWLCRAADAGRHLAGVGNGVYALAQAGVLAGHRFSLAGDLYQDFIQRFPAFDSDQLIVDRQLVFDRRRISCAGGPAASDAAVHILRRRVPIADIQRALRCLQTNLKPAQARVQPPPPEVSAECPPVVQRAVLLMQQYAGQALSLPQLADRLGLSPRQLQRLFRQHLGSTPQAHARKVRLQLAAWMLQQTDKSIATVASESGFSDAAHMGRAFRAAYGQSPGQWRRQANKSKNTV